MGNDSPIYLIEPNHDRNSAKKLTIKQLSITIPEGCDRESYIRGLKDGITRERKRIREILKEEGLL